MTSQRFLFHLKDLQYEYRSNSAFRSNALRFKNMPNTEMFNPDDRYEMVLLINALQTEWSLSSLEDCAKIERLLKTQLPENIRTQIEVADWLVLHWNNHELFHQTA